MLQLTLQWHTSYFIPRSATPTLQMRIPRLNQTLIYPNHRKKKKDFPLCSAQFKSQALRSLGAGLRSIYSNQPSKALLEDPGGSESGALQRAPTSLDLGWRLAHQPSCPAAALSFPMWPGQREDC